MTVNEQLNTYKKMIEAELTLRFQPCGYDIDGLLEAMDYSLMAGGKRVRPILTLEFCRACGGDITAALPVACAVEMLHTYSLIHDDLPCMDNDDLRRGKPTCHRAYGEAVAVLAGDALQTEAFGTILRSGLPDGIRAACAMELANASGVDGMCGGQYLDIDGERKTLSEDELTSVHSRKTAALIIAACRMGVTVAGGSQEQIEAASLYAAALGMAFQIRDDVLDAYSTEETLGKPVGSDKSEGKTTFLDVFGADKCREMVRRLTEAAKEEVLKSFGDAGILCELAEELCERES